MSKIIFIGNYKGGVGKTTTTINLARYFSEGHKKVLTIDLDPQSSLSEIQISNFAKKSLKEISDKNTLNYIYDIYIRKLKKYHGLELKFSDKIIRKYNENYHYIASSLFYNSGKKGLDTLAIEMEDDISYLAILKYYIDTIKDNYDFILIDCPPSSNLITKSAFLMSDYYLIPTVLDEISTNGVIHYIHTINDTYRHYCREHDDAILAKHFFGNRPKLIGIFFNLIRAQVNYVQIKEKFRTALETSELQYPKDIYIFEDKINNYIDIARATEAGQVSKVKNDFANFSQEVMERINELENQK